MTTVYLALGTNLGDRMANLLQALHRLRERVTITEVSSVFETEPWGIAEQPRFLNMAVKGETDLGAFDLLRYLKNIEQEMGRAEGVRYGPRLIDLDILFYGESTVHSNELVIPHPRLVERRFVLVPLVELAPDLIHPELGVSISELLSRLPDAGEVVQVNTSPGSNTPSRC